MMRYFLIFNSLTAMGICTFFIQGCGDTTSTASTSLPASVITVSITEPQNNRVIPQDIPLDFSGNAHYNTGLDVEIKYLFWESDRDGLIGLGSFFRRSGLSVGSHTVRMVAADDDGNTAHSSIQLTVAEAGSNQRVIIHTPAGSRLPQTDFLALSATAFDTSGMQITDPQLLRWESNIDGVLGVGENIKPGGLTPGLHEISLTINNAPTATAMINHYSENIADNGISIHLLEPATGASFPDTAEITFRAAASDANGNALTTTQLVWESSIDFQNPIGIGEACIVSGMSAGTHRISIVATDNTGNVGSLSFNVVISAK